MKYPADAADRMWKGVLLNQFHDIIPGSSIHEVYQAAEKLYDGIQQEANSLTAEAVKSLVSPSKKKVTYFNSLSFDRWAIVELPFKGAKDSNDEMIPVQVLDGKTYAEVYLPACGWTTLTEAKPYFGERGDGVKATKTKLDNGVVEFRFNNLGESAAAQMVHDGHVDVVENTFQNQ